MAIKRDTELDKQAQEWMETVLGEKFPNGTYEDALKNGVILCKYVLWYIEFQSILFCHLYQRLMNKLQPKAIPKFTTNGAGFKSCENISLFRKEKIFRYAKWNV